MPDTHTHIHARTKKCTQLRWDSRSGGRIVVLACTRQYSLQAISSNSCMYYKRNSSSNYSEYVYIYIYRVCSRTGNSGNNGQLFPVSLFSIPLRSLLTVVASILMLPVCLCVCISHSLLSSSGCPGPYILYVVAFYSISHRSRTAKPKSASQ